MELTSKNIGDVFGAHSDKPVLGLQAIGRGLVEEFKSIRLIGEIERPDGEGSYESLRECLKLASWDSPQVCLSIGETDRNIRATLSLFFVWAGIMHYGEEQGHEFWPHLFNEIGLERTQARAQSCGELFLKCLRENSLETFSTLKEGHVYLSRILLHGLIPERHIDRFMNDVILERLNRPHGLYETGVSIVENWREGISGNFPRPIERFLDHGRPVNADLAERILQMAKRWDEDDPAYWWQWGIPQYMVDSFRRCESKKKVQVTHRSRRVRTGANPVVAFDPTRDAEPILAVPSQNLEGYSGAELWYRPLDPHSDEIRKQVELDFVHRSGDNEDLSLPMNIPIGPSTCWNLRLANRSFQIDYVFPEAAGSSAPIFIIGPTGRFITLGAAEMLPEEVGVIYPAEASLDIAGATLLCDPSPLAGRWREWKYCYFSLGEKGTIRYEGPDTSFGWNTKIEIDIERYDHSEMTPRLLSSDMAPAWMKTTDQVTIVFNTRDLRLLFSDQSYSLWKRAIGRLKRLDLQQDKAHDKPFRLSPVRQIDSGRVFDLPEIADIVPGVYEIRLQGALGIDDSVIPFIYLPVKACYRDFATPEDRVARGFSLELSESIDLQAIENTEISSTFSGRTINVGLKEECADAYCALRAFQDTARPTIFLLERSEVRWVRHSETGPIGWRTWRSMPEIMPIQRLDEICDSRAIIELPWNNDEFGESQVVPEKPNLVLFAKKDGDEHGFPVMSSKASRYLPRSRNIWLIELAKFADHFDDLADYRSADIVLDRPFKSAGQIPLFNFLKFPDYRGFALKRDDCEDAKEKLTFNWIPQENEPQKNRFVRLSPVGRPAEIARIRLEDNKNPPLEILLEPLDAIETWSSQIEFIQGRFMVSQQCKDPGTPKAIWVRGPVGWHDWLELPDMTPDQYPNHFQQMEYAKDMPDFARFPLSGYLASFCLDWGQEPGAMLRSLVGADIIDAAVPFAPGHVWEVRTSKGARITLKIAPPEISRGERAFPFGIRTPTTWGTLQLGSRVRFEVQEDHPYIGDRGTVWVLSQEAINLKPSMSSKWGGNLDINYWIKDTIDDGESGVFHPLLPLDVIWDECPVLPLLDQVPLYDKISIPKDGVSAARHEIQPEVEKAMELVGRWITWIQTCDLNPLLKRAFQGRAQGDKVDLLSAVCAWIVRLQAHRYERSIARHRDPNESPLRHVRVLHDESLEYVKTYLPRAFLRDLILSDLIIAWYWNKKYSS